MDNSIAIGIPFLASKHTKALELCLLSIRKYIPNCKEVFLQLDITNKDLYDEFSMETILKINPNIIIKYYERTTSGDYKQALIDWLIAESTSTYAIILHSDVFFWKNSIEECLIKPLIDNPDTMICCWKTVLTQYESTFHKTQEQSKRFWVAPRIATWLFSLNINLCKQIDESFKVFWKGHYWITNGNIANIPVNKEIFIRWLKQQENFEIINKEGEKCLIDIGTFLRMYWDMGKVKGICLGELNNPSFKTLDLLYQPDGFVHIEQYDPERFDDQFYEKTLMDKRTKLIEKILKAEYNA